MSATATIRVGIADLRAGLGDSQQHRQSERPGRAACGADINPSAAAARPDWPKCPCAYADWTESERRAAWGDR